MLRSFFCCMLMACTLFLAACGNAAKEENAKLQNEVMKAHDEIMPQMGEFSRKSMKIDSILGHLDSLKAADPSLDTVAKKQELAGIKLKLDDAYEAMNDWMHAFEPDQSAYPDENVKKYLEGEKVKLEVLKRQFNEAKQAADKL